MKEADGVPYGRDTDGNEWKWYVTGMTSTCFIPLFVLERKTKMKKAYTIIRFAIELMYYLTI